MDYLAVVVALVVTASSIAIHLLTRAKKAQPANLPPGSLGLPVIGQSLGLLRAMRGDGGSRWIQDRIDRYGPVSKLSLFGTPTVLLASPAANKFMFFSSALSTRQPRSVQRILGENSILDLHGADHRRVRGALLEFLRPDMLKMYVGRIDGEVRRHLEENWAGRTTVTVLPLMKRLTFDIISALLFGLERSGVRDALAGDFVRMIEGMWAIPANLPFTAFSRSLKASGRARRALEGITREKKAKQLEHGKAASRNNDLITCLLSLRDGHGERLLTDEEIVDNAMVALIAGHDTSSILMTFMVRHLANDDATLATMVEEHEEIARNKGDGEALTWEDLTKMKFTWRVAQETLRIVPPVFGNFRRALEDVEFDGYSIPKGWQVFWTANVTHMDASIFQEPTKFDPSRFENQTASAAPPCSFVAFGGGPRICPGIEFSRIETLVTMHHLVRQFKWKLCCKENTFVRDPMPSPLRGLPIEIERRTAP
ncbi:cytochrome P450 716B1-like [Aegilops tauschii subsp. strangulata]|uniref:Cytochrome P450 716B1 n=1 Tax=Aegilops tauschii subsp. strangulata TaxID=200361 RepID=A0A453BDV4_AEGTS|nr:cytochrome P450 716B1-like [Aegilops tauschii subsp. strangulata]